MDFHALSIAAIEKPIDGATTVRFDVPDSLRESFLHHPGQHLNVEVEVRGTKHRRSYSLHNSAYADESPAITIKAVRDGTVSLYLQDALKVGDELRVSLPKGRFRVEPNESNYRTYFFFAAGSGITPIFSMIKSILVAEPKSHIRLLYGNQNQDTIIFREELQSWNEYAPNRSRMDLILSNPKSSWLSSGWDGRRGRIDHDSVEDFIRSNPPVAQDCHYYICGPGAMNTSVRDALVALGSPQEKIHFESFGRQKSLRSEATFGTEAEAMIFLRGKKHRLMIEKGESVLDAAKRQNVDIPYSCESGVCGSCVARVKRGSVQMRHNMALEDADVARGEVLCCQAYPTSAALEVEIVD